MPRTKTSRDDAVAAVTETFRTHGIEGASLSLLSQATGLGRSSLYHYFPGGKDDMAKAALEQIGADFMAIIINKLQSDASPPARVAEAVEGMKAFYDEGRAPCFVELFGLPAGQDAVPDGASFLATGLFEALSNLAGDAGFDRHTADLRAEQVLVELQGALVVARALNDPTVFARFTERMPSILLGEI